MSVYVDSMKARFGRLTMSHMIADTDEELRSMASTIGVQQKWHQGDHFDICQSKRALAVRSGAIEITLRQCAAMNFRRKITGGLGSPDEAELWLRNYIRQKKEGLCQIA